MPQVHVEVLLSPVRLGLELHHIGYINFQRNVLCIIGSVVLIVVVPQILLPKPHGLAEFAVGSIRHVRGVRPYVKVLMQPLQIIDLIYLFVYLLNDDLD